MGVKEHFLFSLGRHSKQAGDGGDLAEDISFAHPLDLPFPPLVHHLESLQGSPYALA